MSTPIENNTEELQELLQLVNELPEEVTDAVRYVPQELTEEQKAQARQNIGAISSTELSEELAKRNQIYPEFVNSIEECTDTTKLYVLPDGMIYAYMEASIPGGEPLFVNQLKSSIENDGTPYNGGLGYKTDTRLSSSSSTESTSNATDHMCSGFIPVTKTDTVRIANLTGNTNKYSVVWFYGADFLKRGTVVTQSTWLVPDENGVMTFTAVSLGKDIDDIAYIRFCGIPTETYEDIICTVNQPIEYSAASEGHAWTNTGHAFVPADYEPRIVELEQKATNHTARIIALEKSVESGGADETETAALERIKVWDKPIYDPAPVTLIAEGTEKPALTDSDRTIDAIYAKYRALMAAHPDYITETNMGKSSASDTFTAVDMLRFDFKEPDGLTQPDLADSARHETKPTLIFLSGIHTEWVGVWGLYYALEEIVTNPDFDDIRRNAHIIVIPCANPFCLSAQTVDGWTTSHVNANGVAIHNNFGVDHSTSGTVGAYNYGGSAPYSEPETQCIDAVMAEYPDAVAFVSCHNNDYSTYYGSHVIWASSATYHMCNLAFRLIDKMSKAWLDKYGQTLKDSIDEHKINMDTNDYRLGRATMSTSKGTEQLNATKYGIQGVNLEISRMMKVFSGSTDGTSEVMTHGAEVYANFMRTLLWSYDHKDKREYAPNLPWTE